MEVGTARSIEVGEETQAGEARRAAMTLAREAGFDDVDVGKVGIVVTEAATNMIKHASGGRMVVQSLANGAQPGVGTLALDRGPGLARIAEMMRDGFSTSGTSGTGLGAIVRQSSQFDLYSLPGKGTALYAAIWPQGRTPTSAGVAVGGVSVPVRGEETCGDGWAVEMRAGGMVILVTDGLGHGPLAHEASALATRVFRKSAALPIDEILQRIHEALRATRGAAAAIAEIVPSRQMIRYCGIGNITGRLFAPAGERQLVSHFGTLGHDVRRIQDFQYPWTPEATLILHSDGLGTHWAIGDYPGLALRHPTLIAGVLFRDHARGRDDVTVVAVRGLP